MHSGSNQKTTLVMGIGNLLMGDEGIGVHVIRHLETMQVPEGVECFDGGTGGFHLLSRMQEADKIILIDAAADDSAIGTVRRLQPKYSRDYPRTLSAHDIGLKDLLDAFYLMDRVPDVTLFAVTINPLQEMSVDLSPALRDQVPKIALMVLNEVENSRGPLLSTRYT